MAGFGGAVKLTGESAYRKALKQITLDLKEVDSELKVVATQYAKNDKSEEALTAQSEALTKKLEAQAKKIGVLKDNYTSLSAKAEENKAKHQALTQELESAVKELNQIEQESGKTSKAYQMQASYVAGLTTDYNASEKAIEAQEQALSKARTEINNAQSAYNSTEKALEGLGSEMDETSDDAKELGKEVEDSGEKAESAGNGGFTVFKGVLANLASSAITATVSALQSLGSALIDVGKSAISSYADYEQLTGGIETLFGTNGQTLEEYQQKAYESIGNTSAYIAQLSQVTEDYYNREKANALVLENSANAYKTVGLSANEYMETVTSFSASLISSLGGDTLKATEIADQALADMSDNANKFGSDMSSIQSAYQGFAKQNYTMLDNLKLGYGGTQAEMERLLADAEKISGVKYDISNLSDVYEAIHVIQTDLGITGATALEAEKTISGSLTMLGASWTNLITGLADDNADLDTLLSNFSESVLTVAGNILPRVITFIKSAGSAVTTLLQTLLPELVALIPPLLQEGLPVIITAIESVVSALAQSLPVIIPIIFEALNTLVLDLVEWIGDGSNVTELLNGILNLVIMLADNFSMLLPVLLPAVVNLIAGVAEFVSSPDNILLLVNSVLTAIGAIVVAIAQSLPNILTLFSNLGYNIVDSNIRTLTAIKDGFLTAINWIKSNFSTWINNIKSLVNTGKNNLINTVNNIKTKVTSFATEIFNKIKELPSKVISIGADIVNGIWSGINSKLTYLKNKISEFGTTIINKIKSVFQISSPSKVTAKLGAFTAEGFGVGFEDKMQDVREDINDALPTFDSSSSYSSGAVATTGGMDYYTMVSAFKEALTGVNVELDDKKVGSFVKKTVSNAIYN